MSSSPNSENLDLDGDFLKILDLLYRQLPPKGRTLHLREVQHHELQCQDLRNFSALVEELELGSVFIALDEDEDQDEFIGTTIGGRFELTRLIRRDRHANVYMVSDLDDPAPSAGPTLEARAYSYDGISAKLRRYRKRNMDRLSSRKILKVDVAGYTFIVYKVDVENSPQSLVDTMGAQSLLTFCREPFEFVDVDIGGELGQIYESLELYSGTLNNCNNNREEGDDKSDDDDDIENRRREANYQAESRKSSREKARGKQRQRRIARRDARRAMLELKASPNNSTEAMPSKQKAKRPSPDSRSMEIFRTLYQATRSSGSETISSTDTQLLRVYLDKNSSATTVLHGTKMLELFVAMKKKEASKISRLKAKLPILQEKKKKEVEHLSAGILRRDSDSSGDAGMRERHKASSADLAVLEGCIDVMAQLEATSRNAYLVAQQRSVAVNKRCRRWEEANSRVHRISDNMDQLETFAMPFLSTGQSIRESVTRTENLQRQKAAAVMEEDLLWDQYRAELDRPLNLADAPQGLLEDITANTKSLGLKT